MSKNKSSGKVSKNDASRRVKAAAYRFDDKVVKPAVVVSSNGEKIKVAQCVTSGALVERDGKLILFSQAVRDVS